MSAADRAVDPDLLAAHADGLRALARRLLRDAHRADDVVQDAMLAAVRRPPEDDVPLGPWLTGVVRNLARMARRGDARRAARERMPASRPAGEPADAAVARAETHRRLVDAVIALPEPYRGAVVMRYLDGLSPSEIARRTGEPAATVRTHVHRGLAMLRERLDAASRRDGRSWTAAFALLVHRPALRLGSLTTAAAACVVIGAAAVVALQVPWSGERSPGGAETAVVAAGPARSEAAAQEGGVGRRKAPRARSAADDADSATGVAVPVADADAPPPTAAAGPASLSVEVVDDAGDRVHDGVVRFDLAADVRAANADRFVDARLGAANPFVLAGLPAELDGIEVSATADVPGMPPSVRERATLHAGAVAVVRLVVTKERTATVRVLDRTTESAIAGATVFSETELARRGRDGEPAARISGPGAGVTDADGVCALGGLGAGEHEIVVAAKGYEGGRASWRKGDVRLRLVPLAGTATIVVTVTGDDGRPVQGIRVDRFESETAVTTDAAGRAVFEDVPSGFVAVSLDVAAWIDSLPAGRRRVDGDVLTVNTVAAPGARLELALGRVQATAHIDGIVSNERGAPLAGVAVRLIGMTTMTTAEATTDGEGRVRFERLVGGRYFARFVADGTTWLLGEVEVAPGGMAERAWTLGANTIRGRVVAGPDRRPVADAEVYAIGAAWASTKSGPDGRFAFSGARTGRYAMSARRDAAGARVAGFAVPDDAEIVLELAPHGRLVVRFSKEDRAALLTADVNLFTSDGENAGSLADGEGDDDLVSGGLVPGRYEVEVAALGRTRRFAAEIRADATTVVIVTSP